MNVKALIRRVNHTLKLHKLFPEHSRILIACSGGPDSMALLHLLKDIAIHRHTTYEIGVAIVDHCIRPESKGRGFVAPTSSGSFRTTILFCYI